ncbi:hypothetical protein [Caulobacter segnis]
MRVSDIARASVEEYFSKRIRVLERQLCENLPSSEGPPPLVQWRLKSDRSILEKHHARLRDQVAGPIWINDFVGIRLVLPHRGVLDAGISAACSWARSESLSQLEISNKMALDPNHLYRSVHLDFTLPPQLAERFNERLGVEIQITTYLQNFSATISHQMVYRHGIGDDASRSALQRLAALSRTLHDADEIAAAIFKAAGTAE